MVSHATDSACITLYIYYLCVTASAFQQELFVLRHALMLFALRDHFVVRGGQTFKGTVLSSEDNSGNTTFDVSVFLHVRVQGKKVEQHGRTKGARAPYAREN